MADTARSARGKHPNLCAFSCCVSAAVNSPFVFLLGEGAAGSVSCKVPRVPSHGGQRTSDHIHGFGCSWWVTTTSHTAKTDTFMSRQAWNGLANLSACVFFLTVQQKENKSVFLQGTTSWKNSCMCEGHLLTCCHRSCRIILSEHRGTDKESRHCEAAQAKTLPF